MERNIFATCQCGDVKFESKENPVIELSCHCTDCRQALGADFATISFFKVAATTVCGELSEHHFVAASGNQTVRQYCINCNDVMFDKSSGFSSLIGVISSKISAPYKSSPAGHIWVSSKLPNVVIPKGIQQYKEGYF